MYKKYSYNAHKSASKPMDKQRKPSQNYKPKLSCSQNDSDHQIQHRQYNQLAKKLEKQNQYNKNLQHYMQKTDEYQHNLRMKNLSLRSTINSLLSHKQSLQHSQQQLTQKLSYDNQQIMNIIHLQNHQLQHDSSIINNLMENRNLFITKGQKLELQLNDQNRRRVLQQHYLNVRMKGIQLSTQHLINKKNQFIQHLQNKIKISDLEKEESNKEKQRYKLSFLDHKLEQQKWRKQQKNRRNSAYYQNEAFTNKQQILSLQKQLGKMKNQRRSLKQQILQLKDQVKNKNQQQLNKKLALQNSSLLANKNINLSSKDKKKIKQNIQIQIQQAYGMLTSILTLRNGINRQIMQIFTKSVIQADKTKSNSFKIFIQKWRTIEMSRIQPYVQAYMEARQVLIQFYRSSTSLQHASMPKLLSNLKIALSIDLLKQQSWQLPHHLAIQSPGVYKTHSSFAYKKKLQNRTQINLWILSTIQFTLNQRKQKLQYKNIQLDSQLLYLFRMLAVQHKINYPPKGQKYNIDGDVRNCLLDSTILTLWNTIQCM